MSHADAHMVGAGVSVYKELSHDASLQTPCRPAYGSRTVQSIVC